MARKKTTKELRKLTCRGSTSPLYTSYALLVVSLLGGNRNHVTNNCENPQLRNAQLPDEAVTLCACANSYISCTWTFAGAFAYFCVYSCYFKTLTFYPWMCTFATLSDRENPEQKLRVYVLLRENARECARPQMCACVHSNKNGLTGENTFAFATGVYYNVVFMS